VCLVLVTLAPSAEPATTEQPAGRLTEQQQTPTFRRESNTVAVYATARDRNGQLVPDLARDEFEILEDGKPAALTTFSTASVPITATLLLDMSNSVVPDYFRMHAAARTFIRSLRPDDRLALGTFGRETAVSPLLTGDVRVLERVLDEEVWPIGGGTPLWRAIGAGLGALRDASGRRVVLVVSDGLDSGSDFNCAPLVRDPRGAIGPSPGRRDVERRTMEGEIMLYGIGLGRAGLDPALIELIRDTGGGYVTLGGDVDLVAAFARIADELHHEYSLGFSPAALDGRIHRIEVRATRPRVEVTARRSYIAGVR
jgi:Ca-activated chloride channel family protein